MKLVTALILSLSATAAFAQTTQPTGRVTEMTFTSREFHVQVRAEFFADDYVVKPTDTPAGPAQRMFELMNRFRQAKTLDQLKALYTRNNAAWFDQNLKAMQKVLDQNAKPMEKRGMVDSKVFLIVSEPADPTGLQYIAWGPASQSWERARLPAAVYVVRSEDGVDKFDFELTKDPIGVALSKGQWAQFGAPKDVKGAPATKPAK